MSGLIVRNVSQLFSDFGCELKWTQWCHKPAFLKTPLVIPHSSDLAEKAEPAAVKAYSLDGSGSLEDAVSDAPALNVTD